LRQTPQLCISSRLFELSKNFKFTPEKLITYILYDAEYQNRIILHDNTLNLPVVARQPHPDPNYASHTAARRVAGA